MRFRFLLAGLAFAPILLSGCGGDFSPDVPSLTLPEFPAEPTLAMVKLGFETYLANLKGSEYPQTPDPAISEAVTYTYTSPGVVACKPAAAFPTVDLNPPAGATIYGCKQAIIVNWDHSVANRLSVIIQAADGFMGWDVTYTCATTCSGKADSSVKNVLLRLTLKLDPVAGGLLKFGSPISEVPQYEVPTSTTDNPEIEALLGSIDFTGSFDIAMQQVNDELAAHIATLPAFRP
jgi:hypothetical protein